MPHTIEASAPAALYRFQVRARIIIGQNVAVRPDQPKITYQNTVRSGLSHDTVIEMAKRRGAEAHRHEPRQPGEALVGQLGAKHLLVHVAGRSALAATTRSESIVDMIAARITAMNPPTTTSGNSVHDGHWEDVLASRTQQVGGLSWSRGPATGGPVFRWPPRRCR